MLTTDQELNRSLSGRYLLAARKARPLLAFRVYCSRSSLGSPAGRFYLCLITPSLASIRFLYKAFVHKPPGRTAGFCHSPHHSPGLVAIPSRSLGAGIVSHELTHAAHFELAFRFPNALLNDEKITEPLAWLQGWLVFQFWNQYYLRKPWEQPANSAWRKKHASVNQETTGRPPQKSMLSVKRKAR